MVVAGKLLMFTLDQFLIQIHYMRNISNNACKSFIILIQRRRRPLSEQEVSKEEQRLATQKLAMIHIPQKRESIHEITTDSRGFKHDTFWVPAVVSYDIRIDFSKPIPFICDTLSEPQQANEATVVRLPLLYSPAFIEWTAYDEIEYQYYTIELRDDRDTGVSDKVYQTSNCWNNVEALTLTEEQQREARQYLDLQLRSRGMTCEQLLREENARRRSYE